MFQTPLVWCEEGRKVLKLPTRVISQMAGVYGEFSAEA